MFCLPLTMVRDALTEIGKEKQSSFSNKGGSTDMESRLSFIQTIEKHMFPYTTSMTTDTSTRSLVTLLRLLAISSLNVLNRSTCWNLRISKCRSDISKPLILCGWSTEICLLVEPNSSIRSFNQKKTQARVDWLWIQAIEVGQIKRRLHYVSLSVNIY